MYDISGGIVRLCVITACTHIYGLQTRRSARAIVRGRRHQRQMLLTQISSPQPINPRSNPEAAWVDDAVKQIKEEEGTKIWKVPFRAGSGRPLRLCPTLRFCDGQPSHAEYQTHPLRLHQTPPDKQLLAGRERYYQMHSSPDMSLNGPSVSEHSAQLTLHLRAPRPSASGMESTRDLGITKHYDWRTTLIISRYEASFMFTAGATRSCPDEQL